MLRGLLKTHTGVEGTLSFRLKDIQISTLETDVKPSKCFSLFYVSYPSVTFITAFLQFKYITLEINIIKAAMISCRIFHFFLYSFNCQTKERIFDIKGQILIIYT